MGLTHSELAILSELLNEVLDLPADSQESWLDALDGPRAHLRGTLRELLSKRDRIEASEFLSTLPPLALSPTQVASLHQFMGLQPGVHVGPYELVSLLGAGGFGSVWLAKRKDGTLKRPVALKLPYAALHSTLLIERFARERDILAGLSHPNIAHLYDAGITEAGQPYLALEYVDGATITAFSDTQRLPIRRRLELFLQVLAAVQFAHSHLIIHRDLKPSNILVTTDGQVMLLDFGIAKLMVSGEARETELTLQGGRALTLDYASPEQILGQPLTTASDVYALGVILYELLTGERPHKPKSKARGALEEAVVTGDAQFPSRVVRSEEKAQARAASPRRLAKALAGDLDTIVMTALRVDAGRRYSGAQALADDIARYLTDKPVLAQPDSAVYRARKFLQRNKLVTSSAFAIVVALVVGLGIALWQAGIARQQATAAQQQAAKAKAVQEFLLDLFRANSDKARDPIKARQTTARELLDLGAQQVTKALASAPDSQQEVLATLTDMYFDLGLDEQASELERQRINVLRKFYGARDPRLAESLIAYAATLHDTPHRELILPALDEARAILDAAHDYGSNTRGELLIRYAQRYQSISYDKMKDFADQSVTVLRAHPASERNNLSTALHLAARARSLLGDDRGAESLYQQTLKATEVFPNAPDSIVIPTLIYLAETQYHLLEIPQAEATYRMGIARAKERSGPQHVNSIQAESRFGGFLHATSRRTEGRALLIESLREAIALKGDQDSLLVPQVRSLAAHAAIADGRLEEAKGLIDRVLESNRKNYPQSAVLAANLRDAAAIATAVGDYGPARAMLEEAITIWRTAAGDAATLSTSNGLWLERANLDLAVGDTSAAAADLGEIHAPADADKLPLVPDQLRADLLRARLELLESHVATAESIAGLALSRLRTSSVRPYFQELEADATLALGEAQLRAGEPAVARVNLERSRELRMIIDSDKSPWLAESEFALAACLSAQREHEAAIKMLADARRITSSHAQIGRQLRGPLPELSQPGPQGAPVALH